MSRQLLKFDSSIHKSELIDLHDLVVGAVYADPIPNIMLWHSTPLKHRILEYHFAFLKSELAKAS